MTHDQAIQAMKQWCNDNYSNGADTMVECWSTSDYADLLNEYNGDYKQALNILKRLAGVYEERKADAHNSAF